jgi:hypothetical protein
VIGGVAAGAVAFAATGHGREMMMRRMAVAAIDGALDEARATPEQRTAIHAARDRVFAAVEEHRKGKSLHSSYTAFTGASYARPRARCATFRPTYRNRDIACPRLSVYLIGRLSASRT